MPINGYEDFALVLESLQRETETYKRINRPEVTEHLENMAREYGDMGEKNGERQHSNICPFRRGTGR